MVSRKNFKPGPHRRVCSAHFPGGAKTYNYNIPTIVPKNVHLTVSKPHPTQRARNRKTCHSNTDFSQASCKSIGLESTELLHFSESSNVEYTVEVDEHEDCQEKIEELSLRIVELENKIVPLKEHYESEIKDLEYQVFKKSFTIERFKDDAHLFKFLLDSKTTLSLGVFFNLLVL